MHDEVSTKAIAACFGLCAFCIAIVVGIIVDNPIDTVILRAVGSMVVGVVAGLVVGVQTTKVVNAAIIRAADAAKSQPKPAEVKPK